MSSDTRSSIRASERRRQRVVVSGVAGVAVLTAGAIAYWPGGGSLGGATAAGPGWAVPGTDATGASQGQGWDPTTATTTPEGAVPGDSSTRASRDESRTSLAPSTATATSPTGQAQAAQGQAAQAQAGQASPGAGSPSPTSVPVLPSTSQAGPTVSGGGVQPRATPQSTSTPTPSMSTPSTSTTSATPVPTTTSTPTVTPTPLPTKPKHRCIIFVLC